MLEHVGSIDLPAHHKPGGFDHAAVHHGAARLFVAHTANDALEVIDTERDRHTGTIEGHPGVAGALVDEGSGLVFTSDRAAGTVTFFPHAHPAARRAVPVGGKPNGLAFAPDLQLLLAANVGMLDGSPGVTVSFVDVEQGTLLADVPVPGRTRWAVFDSKRNRFYVNAMDPAQVLVFNAASPAAPPASIPVAFQGPHGLDLDPATDRLFCACDAGVLIALDARSHEETGRADLAGVPDVLFVNPARRHVYVAIGDPGVVQAFHAETLALLQSVPTEAGAHTIGFDAARNKVYAFLPKSCRAAVFTDAGGEP